MKPYPQENVFRYNRNGTFLYESLEKEAEIFGEEWVRFGSLFQYPEANIVKVGLSEFPTRKSFCTKT